MELEKDDVSDNSTCQMMTKDGQVKHNLANNETQGGNSNRSCRLKLMASKHHGSKVVCGVGGRPPTTWAVQRRLGDGVDVKE